MGDEVARVKPIGRGHGIGVDFKEPDEEPSSSTKEQGADEDHEDGEGGFGVKVRELSESAEFIDGVKSPA